MPAHNFDQYAIYLFSSKSTGEASSGYVAGIYFYQGGKYRGRAFFYPDGRTLPDLDTYLPGKNILRRIITW